MLFDIPEEYLDLAVRFGGRAGVLGAAYVIKLEESAPRRSGQRRQLNLVAHVLVVGVDGAGALVARPHKVCKEGSVRDKKFANRLNLISTMTLKHSSKSMKLYNHN